MREPDRSNLASFYDPDHDDNHMMPEAEDKAYWVELYCDDGEQFGWGGSAMCADDAADKAWRDAKEWGYKPAEIKSCEVTE